MKKSPTKSQIISDVKMVQSGITERISRDYFREHGQYSERQWQKHFPTFSALMSAAGFNEEVAPAVIGESNEVTDTSWTISLPKTRICTLEELIKYCKVDLSIWKVDRFTINKWEQNSDAKGITPLFQVKAVLVRKLEISAIKEEIKALKELAKKDSKVVPLRKYPKPSGLMLELCIPDLHVGKISWSKATREANFDVNIAIGTFRKALSTLLQRIEHLSFEKIVFVIGNDGLQTDNKDNQTTAGTAVDADIRYHRSVKKYRELMIESIGQLLEIAPVHTIVVSGNHDWQTAFHVGDSLECWYHANENVTVDNDPAPRKYIKHGQVMLCFTHGNNEKRKDLPLLVATEQKEMFGSCKYVEIHTGHLHTTSTDEQHGVRVRILPALCPADQWHAIRGFTGNIRSAEGYVWSKTEGLISVVTYNHQESE